MDQLLEGLCDLCGKEVDAKVEVGVAAEQHSAS
jgi:hypothetical protein